jgi:hypothetical protein
VKGDDAVMVAVVVLIDVTVIDTFVLPELVESTVEMTTDGTVEYVDVNVYVSLSESVNVILAASTVASPWILSYSYTYLGAARTYGYTFLYRFRSLIRYDATVHH